MEDKEKLTLGILAHVDAGKTTLAESILYLRGSIRKIGRVDHGDAFLDNYELERSRGITIFSKQARLTLGNREVTLLDTRAMWTFLRRWNAFCRFWIARCLLSVEQMVCRDTHRHYGSY